MRWHLACQQASGLAYRPASAVMAPGSATPGGATGTGLESRLGAMALRYLRPNPAVLDQFEQHASRMRDASRARKRSVAFRNVVDDRDDHEVASVVDSLGKPMPSDVYEGDTHLRTLRTLLSMIDERGWERCAKPLLFDRRLLLTSWRAPSRSAHQIKFHDSFERCVARVIYRKDWSTRRPAIMRHNGWAKCSSEVMIRYALTQTNGPHAHTTHTAHTRVPRSQHASSVRQGAATGSAHSNVRTTRNMIA